jgi:hypothetical protein
MSSTSGGTFTGTQPTSSNSVTVVPTATGSVTYTLTCMGAGGSASAMATVTVKGTLLSTLSVAGITTIGSTIDPTNQDFNPYGLTIAPATSGPITKGDLIACNFSAANPPIPNEQGTGSTIVRLHPTPGATPYPIAQSADLTGCNALTMLPDDSISAAAFSVNGSSPNPNPNPLVSATGMVDNPFGTDSFGGPWGEAYAAANGSNAAAVYVSNVDGSIDRISLSGDTQTAFTQIATGFCHSGSPGAVLAPSGLTYDPSIDTLYIVDTSSYSVVAFANVSSIGSAGVVVNGQCSSVTTPPTPMPTFSGPSSSSARVVANGGMLYTPLSAALLPNGDLLVENADIVPSGVTEPVPQNQVLEISPLWPGGFVGSPVQLDSGMSGALFGIAITADANNNPVVYFNDDNANAVMMITVAPSSPATPASPMPPGY